MPTDVRCEVPLTIRIVGRPREGQWAQLEDRLTARYVEAVRAGLAAHEARGRYAARELVREPYDAQRGSDGRYQIVGYQDGAPTELPVQAGDPTLTRTSSIESVDEIIARIRATWPSTNGLPQGGMTYGVYAVKEGHTTHRIWFLRPDGNSITSIHLWSLAGDQQQTIGLSAGRYTLVARPYSTSDLRGPTPISRMKNPDNLDVSVAFEVAPEDGDNPYDVTVTGTPRFRFRPRLRVVRVRDQSQLADGSEGSYLASVEIWRRDPDGENLVHPLALIYAFITYRWWIVRIHPPETAGGEERRETVRLTETRNAFLHHRFEQPGDYDIICEIRLRDKEADRRPVTDFYHEHVQELVKKMAGELAVLEKSDTEAHGSRKPVIWQRSASEFLAQFDAAIAEERRSDRPSQAKIDALTEARAKAAEQLRHGVLGPFPLRAIFTAKDDAQTRPISLFVAPKDLYQPGQTQTWYLIDLTYPAFYETYDGTGATATEAIRKAFFDSQDRFRGFYPPGRILARVQWVGMDRFAVEPFDFPISTESWKRTAYEWLSIGGQALGALALAASFVFPPSGIVTGAIVVSVAVGASVSIINLADRIATDSFSWDASAIADIVNLAASFTLIGGTVTRGVTRGVSKAIASGTEISLNTAKLASLIRFQRGILYMGLAADVTQGVVVSTQTYLELRDIDAQLSGSVLADYQRMYGKEEGRKRFEGERYARLIGVLARAAANGLLTAISIRSSHQSISEYHARVGTPVPAGTHQQVATARAANASNADDYLRALRDETHIAGSPGARWDHGRFPSAPTGERWRVGDPIDMPSTGGEYPLYKVARERYWKNRAHYELQERANSSTRQQPDSPDPMRRRTDAELQDIKSSGRSPADHTRAGRKIELEHSGVPQRVRNWLMALGFTEREASQLTQVSNPGELMEVNPLEHAFFDAEAWDFGLLRADSAGQQWPGTRTADIRLQRPLISMDDATIIRIVNEARQNNRNWNASDKTRQLRDAVRSEINVRNLPITPP
jgi:hypothetical protein